VKSKPRIHTPDAVFRKLRNLARLTLVGKLSAAVMIALTCMTWRKDMKAPSLYIVLVLLAGCSRPTGETPSPPVSDTVTPSNSTDTPAASSAASTVSATGVVEAVDPAAKTVTIAHGPVAALQWPAMTMTFKAPDADLSSLKQGDHVSFEFTSTGMDGRITAITRQ
jgi:Cu(I)/Ag(I) efflux system protein CusF